MTKDIFAHFSFSIENEEIDKFNNPFQICNNNTNECISNITLYKFLEGNEYNININFTTKIEKDKNDKYDYFYPSYLFFPISDGIIEEKEEGFYYITEPKLYIVNLTNKGILSFYPERINHMLLSYSRDNNIFNNIDDLIWKEYSDIVSISEEEGIKYALILIAPFMINNKKGKFVIANQLIINDGQEEVNITSGKNAIISFKNQNYEDENEGNDDCYNILTLFYSEIKNMILINSDNLEYSDFIAQNSYSFPVYIDKNVKENTIKIKTYKPKYAYFGVINQYLINSYISLLPSISEQLNIYDLSQILPEQLFPLNIRINTDLITFYDWINFF